MAGSVGDSPRSIGQGGAPDSGEIQVRALRTEINALGRMFTGYRESSRFRQIVGTILFGNPSQQILTTLNQKFTELQSLANRNDPHARAFIHGAISDMKSVLVQLKEGATENQNQSINSLEENLNRLDRENIATLQTQISERSEEPVETIDLGDGGLYIGHTRDGKPHGLGIEIWGDFRYEGEYENGVRRGHGRAISSGGTYEGNFENGEPHGFGRFVFRDGRSVIGEFDEGQLIRGTMRWPNGDKYIGPFSDFEMHGRGTMYFVNGDSFSGNFVDGLAQGQVTYLYANADVGDGTMVDGVLQGPGSITHPSPTTIVYGNFNNGVFTQS